MPGYLVPITPTVATDTEIVFADANVTSLNPLQSVILSGGVHDQYDVAFTYDGTTARLFVDGVLEDSEVAAAPATATFEVPDGSTAYSPARFMVGRDDNANQNGNGAYSFPGTIDEVRLSSVARYTADYTPSATPFSSDADTILLAHLDSLVADATPDSGPQTLTGTSVGIVDPTVAASPFSGFSNAMTFDGVRRPLPFSIPPTCETMGISFPEANTRVSGNFCLEAKVKPNSPDLTYFETRYVVVGRYNYGSGVNYGLGQPGIWTTGDGRFHAAYRTAAGALVQLTSATIFATPSETVFPDESWVAFSSATVPLLNPVVEDGNQYATWGGYDFTTPDSDWIICRTDKVRDIFLEGETVEVELSQIGEAGLAYELRDYYGTLIDDGPVVSTTLDFGEPPLGWYRLYLTATAAKPSFSRSRGVHMFQVVRETVPGADMPERPADRWAIGRIVSTQTDGVVTALMMPSMPERYVILPAESPHRAGDPQTSSIETILDNRYYRDLHVSTEDPVRPVEEVVLFPNGTDGVGQPAGVTEAVDSLYPTIKYYEGPYNEPQSFGAAALVPRQEIFYDAVKAGNLAAKVLSPNPVAHNLSPTNFLDGQAINWLDNFFEAGGGDFCDGVSVHSYNCFNGDISLARRTLTDLQNVLIAHGQEDKELWLTELGHVAIEPGAFKPRQQAQWLMQQMLIQEQFGIPRHRFCYFYIAAGFYNFPAWFQPLNFETTPFSGAFPAGTIEYNYVGFGHASNVNHYVGPLYPATAMLRVLHEETWGKPYSQALDFGNPGNDMYVGTVFEAAGAQTIALVSGGLRDSSLRFAVSGAASFTLVDCFGNTSTLTPSGGEITVPVDLEPCYLRVPVGSTAILQSLDLGANVAEVGTAFTSTGETDNIEKLNDGIQQSSYLYSAAETDHFAFPYIDTTATLPGRLGVQWATSKQIDRVIVFCAPPWQNQGTLLDFDVQTLDADGVTWTTRATIVEPTFTKIHRAWISSASSVEDYFSNRWIFDVPFSSVSTRGVRLHVRDATYGGGSEVSLYNAGAFATAERQIVVRELMAMTPSGSFGSWLLQAPITGDVAAVITITAGALPLDGVVIKGKAGACPVAGTPDVLYTIVDLPAQHTIVIDASRETVTVTDASGDAIGSLNYLDFEGLLRWLRAPAGTDYCVTVDASASLTADGASLLVESVLMEL